MVRFKVYADTPHKRSIDRAVAALKEGQLIIYPTDTVYGLGGDLFQKRAIEQIYRIKGKTKYEPLSIICHSIQQASQYGKISNFAFRIIKRCTPGPYTFILEATREIPKLMLSRRKEVGIRIPDSAVVQAIVASLGHPLVNSSITLQEDEVLNDPDEIARRFEHQVAVLLDAGTLPDPRDSTIVKMMHQEIEIIREGKGDLDCLYY